MAAKKRKALGAGLDTLIPIGGFAEEKPQTTSAETAAGQGEVPGAQQADSQKEEGPMRMVRLSSVEPDRSQPRKTFPEESLNELASSIQKNGLIEPIVVVQQGSRYLIVAGERRWRACQIAGIKEIPVIVREFESDQQKVEFSLIENIQREDLNPIDEALAYRRLIEEYHLTQEEVAERVSKSRATVANSLRLLNLCDYVRQLVIDGKISMGHARAMAAVEDEEIQKQIADRIIAERLSVREVEKLIRNLGKEKPEKKTIDPSLLAQYKDLTNKISQSLSMKVDIKPSADNKGKVVIEYASSDDFEKIMDRFM